jgi:ribonuclease T1
MRLAALLAALALAAGAAALAGVAEIEASALPPEARQTIALVRAGGPFPYQKDGTVFDNREGLLPRRARGYYREYTVRTPGARDRGARRIVAGRAGELYYTDDHYRSFHRVRE